MPTDGEVAAHRDIVVDRTAGGGAVGDGSTVEVHGAGGGGIAEAARIAAGAHHARIDGGGAGVEIALAEEQPPNTVLGDSSGAGDGPVKSHLAHVIYVHCQRVHEGNRADARTDDEAACRAAVHGDCGVADVGIKRQNPGGGRNRRCRCMDGDIGIGIGGERQRADGAIHADGVNEPRRPNRVKHDVECVVERRHAIGVPVVGGAPDSICAASIPGGGGPCSGSGSHRGREHRQCKDQQELNRHRRRRKALWHAREGMSVVGTHTGCWIVVLLIYLGVWFC